MYWWASTHEVMYTGPQLLQLLSARIFSLQQGGALSDINRGCCAAGVASGSIKPGSDCCSVILIPFVLVFFTLLFYFFFELTQSFQKTVCNSLIISVNFSWWPSPLWCEQFWANTRLDGFGCCTQVSLHSHTYLNSCPYRGYFSKCGWYKHPTLEKILLLIIKIIIIN